ncbi:MAG TPA: xanthine dehydrogenase accessory protein XdhC [Afifellaceae bacterium]|nr:xanthine dehydrogenase accessory protein XdhC [Afifellaceae bacterium]
MAAWLESLLQELDAGRPAMLVHLARVRGSAPREEGAAMLVGESGLTGTIGGGELEYRAIADARRLLAENPLPLIEEVALGPELGQCCGGSVTLMFEPFAPADLAWVRKLAEAGRGPQPVIRTLRIGEGGAMRRDWQVVGRPPERRVGIVPDRDGLLLKERVDDARPGLFLFGAGHVGRAAIRAVAPLDFAITWIDGRVDAFPPDVAAGIRRWSLAMPELAVEEAAPDTWFLVMTHSHPLDEAICEAALKRDDFAYLGLIGSETKAARFRKSLERSGIPKNRLGRLTCPIGLPGLEGKDPATIAASVAADLLMRRQQADTAKAQRNARSGHAGS